MNNAPPPPPPVPTSTPAVGTPEWADWTVRTVLPADAAEAVKACVVHGGEPYASLSRARQMYCEKVIGCSWDGWVARMAWDCIVAILTPLTKDDDIPF